MSTKILDIYQSVLSFAGMEVDDEGYIHTQLVKNQPSTRVPLVINDEPVVFPDQRQFKDPDQKKIYFHPFCENFVRGESEIIEELRKRIATRLNFVISMTMGGLIQVLGTPRFHRQLDQEQKELLKITSVADENSYIEWNKLAPRLIKNSNGQSAHVKIYLKHTGTWKGQPYSRVGIVTFPFYQDLISGKYEGKIRKKDEEVYKKVMQFIFPGLDQPETYNYGTRTRVAPYFDALMLTSANLAARLNEINRLYQDYMDDYDSLIFDMDWENEFQDLDSLRPEISKMPELKGNAGKSSVADKRHPAQEPIQASIPAPPPAPVPAPQPQQQIYQAPQPVAQPAVQQPIYATAPVPVVNKTSEGKINFNDMLRANPMMTQIQNPLAPPQHPPEVIAYFNQYGQFPVGYNPQFNGMQPQGAMAQTVPTWARPSAPQMVPGMNYPPPMYAQPQFAPLPMQPQMYGQPQLPPPPQGFQYVMNPQGQPVLMPIQPQYQQVQAPQGQMPPGWSYNR